MSNGDWSFHVNNQLTRNDHPQYQLASGMTAFQEIANNSTTLVTSLTAGMNLAITGGDGSGHGAITVAATGDASWTNVSSFSNSWTAGSDAPAYRKVGSIVMLRGVVTGGTLASAAFTLPVGYRPQVEYRFATTANAAFADVRIVTTGLVIPNVGSTTNVFINFIFDTL